MAAINPDLKKETTQGLANSGMHVGGIILEIISFVLARSSLLLADIIFIAGAGLVTWTVIRNFRTKHGRGFAIFNIVVKLTIQLIMLGIIISINVMELST